MVMPYDGWEGGRCQTGLIYDGSWLLSCSLTTAILTSTAQALPTHPGENVEAEIAVGGLQVRDS